MELGAVILFLWDRPRFFSSSSSSFSSCSEFASSPANKEKRKEEGIKRHTGRLNSVIRISEKRKEEREEGREGAKLLCAMLYDGSWSILWYITRREGRREDEQAGCCYLYGSSFPSLFAVWKEITHEKLESTEPRTSLFFKAGEGTEIISG